MQTVICASSKTDNQIHAKGEVDEFLIENVASDILFA